MSRKHDSQKRISVTGGAGFLGSHRIDRLPALGAEVVCVDNLFTGSKRNFDRLQGNLRFEFIRHDVTFPHYLEAAEIYNLACPASPIHYQHDPEQTTKTSVHSAISTLGLTKRLKWRILQASTSPPEVTSPINLGNPSEVAIRQLADLVLVMTGSKSAFEYRPLPADNPQPRQLDIGLANSVLGWSPSTALAEGLPPTIDYFASAHVH